MNRATETTPEHRAAASNERRKPIVGIAPLGGRASIHALRLTEIMYNPTEGGAEFLEFTNTSDRILKIGGAEFTDGIKFTFPIGTTLAPGAHAVIAASEENFALAYPGVAVVGEYSGSLANGGETLTLEYPGGWTLLTMTYDDDVPWPTEADGLGNSMVIADTTVDPGDPTNWCASANLMGSPGEDEPQACPTWFDPTEAVFEPGRLLDVRILLDAEDFETLRLQERNLFDLLGDEDCLAEPFGSPFTYFPGSITVDGVPVEQVGVRKKGFLGSLSRGKPSLKVKFDEYVDGQRLSGLRRMTLNNAQQDPSYINQCLGYQLFSAAGVPTPRCNFAVVTVNDEPLGVYVHVESVRTRFLALHFDQNTGDLYEGTLSDFRPGWTGTFELKDDGPDAGGSILEDMVAALDAPDDELVETLEGLIDLDAFLTFWAMEVLVGHWDGYAGNTNNFFVYHDPTDNQLNFMPWGADALFGGGQGAPAVAATSALARRLYLYQPTRDRYVDRVLDLLDTV